MTQAIDHHLAPLIEGLMSQPLARAVEQTSDLLKSWYVLERGFMRAMAGWLPAVQNQEIKLLLARHIWLDAMSADELRRRILQLRYPRRDVDRNWDVELTALTAAATNAPDEVCFIAGLYRTLKPAMQAAGELSLKQSENVGDSPTRWVIEQMLTKIRTQRAEMIPLLESAEARDTADGLHRRRKWQEYLQARWDTSPKTSLAESKAAPPMGAGIEKPFVRPLRCGRDNRYQRRCELMSFHSMFWIADDPGIKWLSHAVAHLNEMWAAEATAVLIYDHMDAPWSHLLDASRWCYDEARHCQMGITRLQRAGLDLFRDVPAPESITFECYEPEHRRERLLAIHGFERGGIVERIKQSAMQWHEEHGDHEGARHYDFDWADESIHLQYGLQWLEHLYGKDILDREFDDRVASGIAYRLQFLQQRVTEDRPVVEQCFQDLCTTLRVPFKARKSENYKGRE